jgi:hypothetical protein
MANKMADNATERNERRMLVTFLLTNFIEKGYPAIDVNKQVALAYQYVNSMLMYEQREKDKSAAEEVPKLIHYQCYKDTESALIDILSRFGEMLIENPNGNIEIVKRADSVSEGETNFGGGINSSFKKV